MAELAYDRPTTTPRHAGFAWMVTQRQQDTPAPAAQLPDYSPESFRAARPYVSGSESEGDDDGEGCDSAILPASNVFEEDAQEPAPESSGGHRARGRPPTR